jgi:hypothetical protein
MHLIARVLGETYCKPTCLRMINTEKIRHHILYYGKKTHARGGVIQK